MENTPNRDVADSNNARIADIEVVLFALRGAQKLFEHGNEQVKAIIKLLGGPESGSAHSETAGVHQGMSEMHHVLTDPDEQLEDE